MRKPIPITEKEKEEYDKPLTVIELEKLYFLCKNNIKTANNKEGLREARILFMKVNNILLDKLENK
jgi:hypothetical protein